MKKISIFLALVALVMAMFAITAFADGFVRGPEGDTIAAEDVESIELISGSTASTNYISLAGALDGNFGTWWGGPTGSSIKITFVNEWEISAAQMIVAANWCSCKTEFFAADGTSLGSTSNSAYTANTDFCWGGNAANAARTTLSLKKTTYTDEDKAVKYIVFSNTGDKWGYLPMVADFILTGRERIPTVGCDKHEFVPVYDPEPTCTESGVVTNTCTKCGATEAPVELNAYGHAFDPDAYTVVADSCEDKIAKIAYTCTRCGEEIVEYPEYIQDVTDNSNPLGLIRGQDWNGGSWTCGSMFDNTMDFQQASSDWHLFAKIELDKAYYIASLTVLVGHDGRFDGDYDLTLYYQEPGSDEWKPAGSMKIYPLDYGYRIPTEHTLVLEVPVYADAIKVDATGVTHGSGIIFEAEVAGYTLPNVSPLGHDWVVQETVPATCDYHGYTEYICASCETVKKDDLVKYTGHAWVNATCFDPKTCSTCGKTEGDPKGHDYKEVDVDGVKKLDCSRCDYVICNSAVNGTYFDSMGESYVFADGKLYTHNNEYDYTYNETTGIIDTNDEAVYFTVTNGVIQYKGAEFLHAHDENAATIEQKSDATCTEDGSIVTICATCFAVLNTETIPAAHTPAEAVQENVVDATCEADGSYDLVVYCSVCNEKISSESVTVEGGHIWGETPNPYWDATPTCVSTGLGTYWCEVCYAESEEVVIPVDPTVHNEESMVLNSTETYYTCNDCKTSGFYISVTGIGNDYYLSIYDGQVMISDADWMVTEYYTYTISGVYPTFTLELTPVDPEMATFAGMAKITFNADDKVNIGIQTANDALYFFGTEYLRGSYEFCPEEGQVLAVTFQDGMVYVLYNTLGLELEASFPYVYNYSAGTIDTNGNGYFFVQDGKLYYGRGWELSAVDYNAELEGKYEFKPEEGASLVVEFNEGMIYILENTLGLDLPEYEGFAYSYNPYKGTIETNGIGYFFVDVITGDLYYGRGWLLSPVKEVVEPDEPEEPVNVGDPIGSFVVVVTDNNTWIDLYTYTAAVAGQYSFKLPAGLGMWRAEHADAWPPLEENDIVDYNDNKAGAYLTVNLEAGETFSFYVASADKGVEYEIVVCYYVDHVCDFVEEVERVESTCTTPGYITYKCTCGATKTENLDLADHTEVEIPAVLPTPSVEGYTAGVECSVCGAEIVAPVAITVTDMADTRDPSFRIASASLSAAENIAVNYYAVVTEGYNNPYMVFVFDGEEYIVTDYTINASNGRLRFNFAETFPQKMMVNIEAYVYAETAEGEYSRNCILEYSVMQYILGQLKKGDAALTTVMSDILYMGAMTQLYTGYMADTLVTDAVEAEGYTLTPSAFTSIPASCNIQAINGDRNQGYDWKSGTLAMGSRTEVKLTFAAEDIEGLVVKINVAGATYDYDPSELEKDEKGRYVMYVTVIAASEYNEVMTCTFEKDGAQIGSTLIYSVNTFLSRNYENSGSYNLNARNLMKAIYTYGESIAKYFA